MKKTDTWVILRLDEEAIALKDYIAVKGVYDQEDSAQAALPKSDEDSSYLVVRSRRYYQEGEPQVADSASQERIQGIPVQLSSQPMKGNDLDDSFQKLRELWDCLPQTSRRQAILPLLSQLSELAVAKATGASRVDDSHEADLKLPNDQRIEVKTVLLNRDRQKAPNLQLLTKAEFDFLVIVIFNPELGLETARMIPVDALQLYARPASHQPNPSRLNLRVTLPLLNYPGSQDLDLTNYSLKVG